MKAVVCTRYGPPAVLQLREVDKPVPKANEVLIKVRATTVTAVDGADKLDALRTLGADRVIDYAREDFAQSGERYDVVFDVAGKSSYGRSVRALRPGGYLLIANPTLTRMIRGAWTSRVRRKRVVTGVANYRTEDLERLKELVEAGALSAVIDKRYPLEQLAEAHRYVDSGKKIGHVVITVG